MGCLRGAPGDQLALEVLAREQGGGQRAADGGLDLGVLPAGAQRQRRQEARHAAAHVRAGSQPSSWADSERCAWPRCRREAARCQLAVCGRGRAVSQALQRSSPRGTKQQGTRGQGAPLLHPTSSPSSVY